MTYRICILGIWSLLPYLMLIKSYPSPPLPAELRSAEAAAGVTGEVQIYRCIRQSVAPTLGVAAGCEAGGGRGRGQGAALPHNVINTTSLIRYCSLLFTQLELSI